MKKIKILLVEDEIMMKLGTAMVIENNPNFELVSRAEDGESAIKNAIASLPDVILMDIGLPKIDGIEATQKIKEIMPDVKILMFTSRFENKDVFSALKAGADGYITKGATPDTLIGAINTVYSGAAWLDPMIAKAVLSSINQDSLNNNDSDKAKNKFGLTKRELEVLELIVEGLEDKEISERLVIELTTTKAHVHSILQKLSVNLDKANRTKAAVFAVKEGLI